MKALSSVSRMVRLMAIGFIAAGLTHAGNAELQAQADALYASERYAEAHLLLEKLVEVDSPSGSNLYRLAYCQRLAGAQSAADATQARAIDALEHEFATANSVEIPFYLANGYSGLGRVEDMRRVAAETTERIEQGDIPAPKDGIGQFQLGKLYADQDLDPPAREWYAKAVDALEREVRGGGYLRWSSRYLAERSWADRDFEATQRYLSIVTEGQDVTASELERLAVASVRTRRYAQASAAWDRATTLNPAVADRSRYGSSLARMAQKIEPLPESSPSGASWSSLDQVALETLMREQADAAKEIQRQTAAQPMTRDERRGFREKISEHQRWLVTAALEYTTRGYSIRETAFFGGYAPFILNPKGWALPRPVDAGQSDEPDESQDAPGDENEKGKNKKSAK